MSEITINILIDDKLKEQIIVKESLTNYEKGFLEIFNQKKGLFKDL